jgi:hypothetical protein
LSCIKDWNRQRRPERAHVSAEEALDEQPRREQGQGVHDERPFAREFQDNRGLEGFDLGPPGSLLRRKEARV